MWKLVLLMTETIYTLLPFQSEQQSVAASISSSYEWKIAAKGHVSLWWKTSLRDFIATTS